MEALEKNLYFKLLRKVNVKWEWVVAMETACEPHSASEILDNQNMPQEQKQIEEHMGGLQ